MKSFKITLVFIMVSFFLSCDTDMDDIDLSTAEAKELNLIVKEGEWRISLFSLNASEKTANYEDYIFVFEESNDLSATSSNDQTNGTWRVSNDSGSEFESYNDVDFNVFFSSDGKFGELTSNYDVISANKKEINLIFQDSENGNTARLSFSKN
ncbi:hypothetical protein [Christiangramia forsetii]|uniref:Uncharacterized protein n=2 Tax=Christiangramia forsetii TaxID=411153 RepID=A0M216_CHRFK|nr:hypothetical protein [Christiangramia forsetii]GGG44785.1 hypothetical protein GCM10011532_30980 [Christiangramia forsetii]CAL66661.1 conserved hypothetical protein [Christiangramia forsetii KT0803]